MTDNEAVDEFADAMKAKLKKSAEEKGRSGWQGCSRLHLITMLQEHIVKNDMVDVANLAMMVWHNRMRH